MANGAPGIQGYFFGLDAATLATMLTEWQACLSGIAVAGQSYTISGRQFNRANLAEVAQMVMEINAAIAYINGTRTTQVYARFNNNPNTRFTSGVNGTLTGP